VFTNKTKQQKAYENVIEIIANVVKESELSINEFVFMTHADVSAKWHESDHTDSFLNKDGSVTAKQIKIDVQNALDGKGVSNSTSKPADVVQSVTKAKLAVDGYFGKDSVKALQELFGTPADGYISGQYRANSKYLSRFMTIEYGSGGSPMVVVLQNKLGVETDGILGANTIKALQKKLKVSADGYFGAKSAKALQKNLNKGKLW